MMFLLFNFKREAYESRIHLDSETNICGIDMCKILMEELMTKLIERVKGVDKDYHLHTFVECLNKILLQVDIGIINDNEAFCPPAQEIPYKNEESLDISSNPPLKDIQNLTNLTKVIKENDINENASTSTCNMNQSHVSKGSCIKETVGWKNGNKRQKQARSTFSEEIRENRRRFKQMDSCLINKVEQNKPLKEKILSSCNLTNSRFIQNLIKLRELLDSEYGKSLNAMFYNNNHMRLNNYNNQTGIKMQNIAKDYHMPNSRIASTLTIKENYDFNFTHYDNQCTSFAPKLDVLLGIKRERLNETSNEIKYDRVKEKNKPTLSNRKKDWRSSDTNSSDNLSLKQKESFLDKEKTAKFKLELEKYSPYYQAELEEIDKNPYHTFMKQHFPDMYKINNFYLHYKLLNERRERKLHLYLANVLRPSTFDIYKKAEDQMKFNNDNSHDSLKCIWSPGNISDSKGNLKFNL